MQMTEKQTVIPYFMVFNGGEFIDFTEKVFDAEVKLVEKLGDTEGIIHAEMKIGNSTIYFADTSPNGDCGPEVCGEVRDGLIPLQMFIHVENVKTTYEKAIATGATGVLEPTKETGNMAMISDPFGNLWTISE